MIKPRKEKFYTCGNCGLVFSDLDAQKTCSNCFACTGCEIYLCPSCNNEVVVKPMKTMAK